MKKKIFGVLLTLVLAVTCAFGLSACGGNPALTKADYLKVFNSVITTVNNYGTDSQLARTAVSDTDFVTIENVTQAKNVVKGNVAMLYFLKNLCNTENFEVKNDFQDCVVIDNVSSSTTQTFKIRLNMSYDTQTESIKSTVYVRDVTDAETSIYFLEFEFFYDFDTETLNGFNILGIMGDESSLTKSNVNYFKFYNNTLKQLNTTTTVFDNFATDILQETNTYLSYTFGENLPDYSTQYIQAMVEAFGA